MHRYSPDARKLFNYQQYDVRCLNEHLLNACINIHGVRCLETGEGAHRRTAPAEGSSVPQHSRCLQNNRQDACRKNTLTDAVSRASAVTMLLLDGQLIHTGDVRIC